MNWKTCLLCLSLLTGCATESKDIWRPKIYAPDTVRSQVQRAQEGEFIKCNSPEFEDLICIPKADLRQMYKECLEEDKVW